MQAFSVFRNTNSSADDPEYKGSASAQAYTYIALYGKDFQQSGRMAFESFAGSKLSRFATYSVLNRILSLSGFMICTLLGLVASMVYLATYREHGLVVGKREVGLTLPIFLKVVLGNFFLISGINELICGESAAQIAILVEDPERSARTHPKKEKFKKIIEKF